MYSAPGLDFANRLVHVRKTVTFDGGAGSGAQGTVALFNVTGRVWIVNFTGFPTTTPVGANATIAHGTAATTTALTSALTATALTQNTTWVKNTPQTGLRESAIGTQSLYLGLMCEENIIATVATADITAGVIEYDLWYKPITDDGALVAA